MAPTAAAAEISATARMTEDHSIFESIQVKILFNVRGLVCIMEIKVFLSVRNELFYLARGSSLEALSYPSCCCLCRSVPLKKSLIFEAGKFFHI